MSDDQIFEAHLRRRTLLAAGIGGVAAVAAGVDQAQAAPIGDGRRGRPTRIPPVAGLHLQFGADASSEAVVSWHTLQPVTSARVLVGTKHGYRHSVAAATRSYTDAKSGQRVYALHAHLSGLSDNTEYLFLAIHHGAQPEAGSLRTAPRGRSASFTFTSFGDQGTPTVGKKYQPPDGINLPSIPWVNDNLGSPAAGDTTAGIERIRPLFHLFNGDLCYANLAEDRVRTWWDFWNNNTRSARHRPWMPSAGNQENELGNGPIGYTACTR